MHDMITKIAYPHPTFQNMPLDIETEWIIHVETVQTARYNPAPIFLHAITEPDYADPNNYQYISEENG